MLVSSVAPSKRRALAPCIAPVTVTLSVAASPSVTSPFAVTAPVTVRSSRVPVLVSVLDPPSLSNVPAAPGKVRV